MNQNRTYIAIDLKSFYASVECVDLGDDFDTMDLNLVVADESRTEKTICLAVSPSLKALGLPGRARLFEVVQKISSLNAVRRSLAPGGIFTGKSCLASELQENPSLEIDFKIARPRMARYMEVSKEIYAIYLRYVSSEDIHVYSIDEVIMDVTNYLDTYKLTANQLASKMILDVQKEKKIVATAGIGSNMYLCKVAMDVLAKHSEPNEYGVRIAELDEMSYRKRLWGHKPLTDFWRVGRGYAKKLEDYGLCTMGAIARCSLENEDFLYHLFGVNAELLIDHAWGWEPCTMDKVKAYMPEVNSLSSGQVLHCPYDYKKALVVVQEMADALALDLVDKGLVTNQLVLTIGFDSECLTNPTIRNLYHGEISTDFYGRQVPKHVQGTVNTNGYSSSSREFMALLADSYARIVDKHLLIRRITLVANHVIPETKVSKQTVQNKQLDLFADYDELKQQEETNNRNLEKERSVQQTLLNIKKKFGKNSILRGLNLQEGATAKDRNQQIGGHKA
ncbi:MAG: DNA methylase [Bacteroidales bacterium]|nr:DNA methylase [Bacteroidales bacterium]